jgi:hypothetical protein
MRRAALSILLMMASLASPAMAQQASTSEQNAKLKPTFVVRTVPLHHLSSAEAMKLLSPYSQTPGGGVYEVSTKIRAVTIREVSSIFNEMMTVLAQYDRDPATVTLNFQLIAADNGTTRDQAVAGLDSLLRGVLTFSVYRLRSTSGASASEGGIVSQSLAADGEPLSLSVQLSDLRIDASAASVHLEVNLSRTNPVSVGRTVLSSNVLSTGVTVPVGQTVVLGTSTTDGGQKALILTVRPQLSQPKR